MIRVTRLLEYEFADNEIAERSMSHWAVPQNGTKNFGTVSNPRIVRSATIIDLTFEPEDEPNSGYARVPGPDGTTIDVALSAPNLVVNDDGEPIGIVTGYNSVGVGEMIVQFFDGSADSCLINELKFRNGKIAAYKYCDDKEHRG